MEYTDISEELREAMRVFVGVDPGVKAPAHCLSYGREICFSWHPLSIPPRAVVFVEDQFAPAKSGKKALMALGKAAGRAEGAYLWQGATVYRLSPSLWRETILKGNATVPKTIFHNRLKSRGMLPDAVKIRTEDEIDAWLIREAGIRLLETGFPLEKVKWW